MILFYSKSTNVMIKELGTSVHIRQSYDKK